MELTLVQKFAVWILPLLFAITLHEFAHGFVAYKLGDNTAKLEGRLTINPLKHIDWIGTVILPTILIFTSGFLFGWAKPVPINLNNLERPKRDMAIIAIAGPLSNLVMALLWAMVFAFGYNGQSDYQEFGGDMMSLLRLMGEAGVLINVLLMVFNLLPIPPLDGSRIVSNFLPRQLAYQYGLFERYGFIILLVLMFLGVFQLLLPWIYGITRLLIGLFL